jgi:hypothetical protein
MPPADEPKQPWFDLSPWWLTVLIIVLLGLLAMRWLY